MCIYDIIDELININEIKCKTSNQIFSETFHDNSMRFSAITLFNYAQYYSIKSRPLSMTFNSTFNGNFHYESFAIFLSNRREFLSNDLDILSLQRSKRIADEKRQM